MRSTQVLRGPCVSIHTGDGQQEQQSTSLEPHCHGHTDRKTDICPFTDKTNVRLHAQSCINSTPVTIAFFCWFTILLVTYLFLKQTRNDRDGRGEMVWDEQCVLLTFIHAFGRFCSLCLNQRKTNPVRKHTLTLLSDRPITHATLTVFAQPIHMNSWVILRSWKTNTFCCSRKSSSLCCQSQVSIG